MQRVVLVGTGFMGKMHGNVYRLLPNAELVAAVDKDPGRLLEYCNAFGCPGFATLREALDAVDANVVDICLPTDLHRDFALEAAAAGKHVFCEKPMARTVEQAAEMRQACAQAGVELMIGHCIRFWPEYALLKQMVDDQRLGRLLSLNLTRFGEFPSWSSDNWLADERRSGGGVLDMHIHDTDFALYLLGAPEEMVSFGTVDQRGPSFVFSTLRYGDAIIHIEGGWNLPPKTPFKMAFRAIFEHGAAIMDGGPMTIYREDGETWAPEFPKMQAEGGGNISDLGGYFLELQYFVDRLESREPLEVVTPESSALSLKVALAEIEQIKNRRLTAPR